MNAKQPDTSTTPTVIVATEYESVVRFYAGHAGNGGMNQTGQFTTSRPIDPTDLANMAVDLANTFGWLVLDTTPVVQRTLPNAPPHELPTRKQLPPSVQRDRTRKRELVECPDPSCTDVIARASIERHVQVWHGWTPADARPLYSQLPASSKPRSKRRPPGKATPPTTRPYVRGNGTNRTDDYVLCPMPGCEFVTMRKNLASHLMSNKHGLVKDGALKIARQTPATELRPALSMPRRHGIAGARELSAMLPTVATHVRTHGPVTSADVGRHFEVQPSTALQWLKRLVDDGAIVDVTQNPGLGVARKFDRVPNSYTEPVVESSMTNEYGGG